MATIQNAVHKIVFWRTMVYYKCIKYSVSDCLYQHKKTKYVSSSKQNDENRIS